MYGEDFDEEYPAITRDLKTKYRKGFTKDELADLWVTNLQQPGR